MTAAFSKSFKVAVLFAILITLSFAFYAYAEDRGARERENTRSVEEAPEPSPAPAPTPTPPPSSEGITSNTSGEVDTGGNTGGHVVTGDEHLEVHEVNIGPTNEWDGNDEETSPPTEPEQDCDSRRTTCTDRERTR